MIKLVVIDLDDTLLRDGNFISDADKAAIKALEENGMKIALASGRSKPTLVDFIKELHLEHFRHICSNGAILINLKGENEDVTYIPNDKYHEILDFLESEDRDHFCYTDGMLMYDEIKGKLWDIISYYHSEKAMIKGDVRKIRHCPRVNTHYANVEEIKYLKSKCPEGVYAVANQGVIDYMPVGMNKMTGIEPLLEEYGITADEVAVFGDQESDKEIFEGCGLSMAVRDCDDVAREAADIILPRTHNEDAVAYGIYRYILKDEKMLEELEK